MSSTYYGVRQGRIHKPDEIMNTLTTTGENGGSSQLIQLNGKKPQAERVYDADGLSVSLSSNSGGLGGKTGLYKVGNVAANGTHGKGNVYSDEGISPSVLACNYKDNIKILQKPKVVGNVNPSGNGMNGQVYDTDGVSPTITTNKGEGVKIAKPVLTPDRENKRQNGRRMKKDGDPMFTLTAQDKHGIYDGCIVRKLTPVECERLQGFPDGWTQYGADGEKISDTQRYKCCGNAVTTTVITAIVDEMFEGVKV